MNAVYANETAHCLLYVCQFEMLAKETFAEAEIMKQLFKTKWKIKTWQRNVNEVWRNPLVGENANNLTFFNIYAFSLSQ